MTTRLDQVLQKHPEHEVGIRALAERDPSGNLKYLDWGAKVLASGQALAPEIADVVDLFHKFGGRWLGVGGRRQIIRHDIYSYRPQDLASLRDNLRKLQRAQDRKRKQREKLYKLSADMEFDVVYDSPDLIVRHIKNKAASAHYGLGTKWCISMLREGYFEDYESSNATFFFWERKRPLGDEYDKIALMIPREDREGRGYHRYHACAFTSLDEQVDMMVLAKIYGPRTFDIFRQAYEHSERYPGSAMFQVFRGAGNEAQLQAAFASVVKVELPSYEVEAILEAICCNDAAPWSLLQDVAKHGPALATSAYRRMLQGGHRFRRRRRGRPWNTKELERSIAAALAIHPSVPDDERETIVKQLRKRHIKLENIERNTAGGRIEIVYRAAGRHGKRPLAVHRHHRRRSRRDFLMRLSVSRLQARVRMFENMVKRAKKAVVQKVEVVAKRAAKAEQKLKLDKARKARVRRKAKRK